MLARDMAPQRYPRVGGLRRTRDRTRGMGVLDGQSALVTGGGSGIGLACAAHVARDGAAVVLAGRNESKLSAAADGLLAEGASEVHIAVCDVTDEDAVREACAVAAGVGRFTMVV